MVSLVVTTSNFANGVVVPIPTLPLEVTTRAFEPTFKSDEKRLVDDAVVEKKFVVVAEVPVAFRKVKFWRVDDAFEINPLLKYQERLSVAVVEAV